MIHGVLEQRRGLKKRLPVPVVHASLETYALEVEPEDRELEASHIRPCLHFNEMRGDLSFEKEEMAERLSGIYAEK